MFHHGVRSVGPRSAAILVAECIEMIQCISNKCIIPYVQTAGNRPKCPLNQGREDLCIVEIVSKGLGRHIDSKIKTAIVDDGPVKGPSCVI